MDNKISWLLEYDYSRQALKNALALLNANDIRLYYSDLKNAVKDLQALKQACLARITASDKRSAYARVNMLKRLFACWIVDFMSYKMTW